MGQVMKGLENAGSTLAKPFVKFGAEGKTTPMPIGGDLEIPFAPAPAGARSFNNAHPTRFGKILRSAAFGNAFGQEEEENRNLGAIEGLIRMSQNPIAGMSGFGGGGFIPQAEPMNPMETIEQRLKKLGISPFNPQSGRP